MDISALQAITECGNGDDDHGPRGLILQEIFSYLDTPTLKEMRLLCKEWEDAASIILGKRCCIPLHRICSGQTTTDKPMDVNPKLIQCMSIFSMTHPVKQGHVVRRNNDPYHCFNSFASVWHGVVQELIVKLYTDTYVGLPETLNAYGFPNLTKMTITKLDEINSDALLPLRRIDTLKELKIMGHYLLESCSYPLLQSLIYSAFNLEVLHIDGNFYPDLAWCRKLKVLNFGESNVTNEEKLQLRAFDPAEMFRILNEVGQHLEHFTLQLYDFVFRTNSRLENVNKRFPILPKLKSLTLKGVDLLGVKEQICPSLFPNLEIVNIHQLLDSGRIDQGSCLTHEGVKSLGLLSVDRPNIITVASKKFPNVKRLVIRIVGTLKEGDATGAKFLGTILQACSTWKLLYLEIQICKGFKLSQLLAGLTSLTVLEGLKQVKILSCCFDTIQDDLGQGHDTIQDDIDRGHDTIQNDLDRGDDTIQDDIDRGHDTIQNDLDLDRGDDTIQDDIDRGHDCQDFKDIFQLSAKMERMILEGLPLGQTTKRKVLEYLKNHKELPVLVLNHIKRRINL